MWTTITLSLHQVWDDCLWHCHATWDDGSGDEPVGLSKSGRVPLRDADTPAEILKVAVSALQSERHLNSTRLYLDTD